MKRVLLLAVNPMLGLLLVTQGLTALLRDFLPHGMFRFVHKGGGFVLIVLAVVHVGLNWSWFRANFFAQRAAGKK